MGGNIIMHKNKRPFGHSKRSYLFCAEKICKILRREIAGKIIFFHINFKKIKNQAKKQQEFVAFCGIIDY